MTAQEDSAPAVAPEVREEAREWFVRGQHTNSDTFRADLATWLAASVDHRLAYDRTAAAHAESAILKRSRDFGTGRQEEVESLPIGDGSMGNVIEFPANGKRVDRRGWPARSVIAAAVAASIILVFCIPGSPIRLFSGGGVTFGSADAAMMTRHGQIRTFRLRDGSIVTLDSDSEVRAKLTDAARNLRMVRGRARVVVASNDPRAFTVDADDRTIEAHHATLDVSLRPRSGVLIHVRDGRVQVRGGAASVMPPEIVSAGEQFDYWSGPYASAKSSAATAMKDDSNWPSGWIETRSMPLASLVFEANRYAGVPILLTDPATRRLEVTGRFNVANTKTFVPHIAELFRLVVERRADGLYLRPR